jgi:hypothetical protein
MAFQPLHDYLLHLLGKIPQDGTNSQDAALQRFRECVSKCGRSGIYISIDISAATDTIPRQLYQYFIEALYGNPLFATRYLTLLAERPFLLPKDLWGIFGFKFTDYWRGQPMGAWSSFPLLGVIHHCIVQWAAFDAGKFPLSEYAVVGDDLIIFDHQDELISHQYLRICQYFGIPISKTKTYRSDRFFNFISRSFLNGDEVTPVSIRHELSIHSMAARVEGALRVYTRWVLGTGTKFNRKGIVPVLARLVSDPWSWSRDIASIQGGYLTSYLALLLSSVFAPFGKSVDSLGVSDTSWLYWAASTRGSASILSMELPEIARRYLKEIPDHTRVLVRTAMLALRSELESSLVSHSKIFDQYIDWYKKQPGAIKLVYPLIRADTEDHACFNMSCREVKPLLGYPPEDSSSLLDEDLNYEELGLPFEELFFQYQRELQEFAMGYYVPRRSLPHIRVFYSAWCHIFSEDTPVEDLGVYLRGAWDAVASFKPMMDYSNVNVLQRVSRDDFGHSKRNSSEQRFIYAKPGVTDRLVSLVSFAWKLYLQRAEQPQEHVPLLPLPSTPVEIRDPGRGSGMI